MRYLVVQDWASTHGNHAGMVHMCRLLKERYPNEYKVIVQPLHYSDRLPGSLLRAVEMIVGRTRLFVFGYHTFVTAIDKCQKHFTYKKLGFLKDGDQVFLLEYLHAYSLQYDLAKYIKRKNKKVEIFALSHMTSSIYTQWAESWLNIKEWSEPIDKMLTLGSSLSEYLRKEGVPLQKISTGFHYVDDVFYKPTGLNKEIDSTMRLKAIVIGSLQRNFELLSNIVRCCTQIDWVVCSGRNDIDALFANCNNVKIKGYLSEKELRNQMDSANISVNVMDDTVGSNVITTSMAMGLAIVVSDVGSIHDYCDNTNALFCENTVDSFVKQLSSLALDKKRVFQMQRSSFERSKKFNISNIEKWFSRL